MRVWYIAVHSFHAQCPPGGREVLVPSIAVGRMRVFVSYALSNRKWVHRFAACLRTTGAEVSSWGSSFHLGGDPDEMLARRMAAVDLVVLVLSEGFLVHGYILNELGTAKLIGKPIISVLIEPGGDAPEALGESTAAAARKVREFSVPPCRRGQAKRPPSGFG